VFNRVGAHYCILNIAWARKLDHNKDSRGVIAITDSQTVQADTSDHETNSKFCLRNTALHFLWCAGLLCGKLRVLCVLFSEVFFVKGMGLFCFHHAKEVCKSRLTPSVMRAVNCPSYLRGEILTLTLRYVMCFILALSG
jgi:hypothetical protein